MCNEESSASMREQLGRDGVKIAEFTVTTQSDTYRGFRACNLYEDAPEEPVFRVLKSPSKPTPFRIQFYTEDFVTWLKDNHDTRGLEFEECDIDKRYYRPND